MSDMGLKTIVITVLHVGVLWCVWNARRYRGGSPTAVQAWQTCPLWEPSP